MKRLILPLLKRFRKPLLAIMLISAIGCSYNIGLSGGYLSLESSINEYLDRYEYPDAVITTAVTDRSVLAALKEVPGVETVNARACADTVLRAGKGRYLSVRCFSLNDDDRWRLHSWSTADGGGADELYLEYNFSQSNGICAGDTVLVKIGEEWREFFVAGIVSAPETMAVQPTDTGWTLSGDFGYVYFSAHLLEKEYEKRAAETKTELDEKSEELDNARRDADDELSDARQQLSDAAQTLSEQEGQLADGKEELRKNRVRLEQAQLNLLATRKKLVSQLEEMRAARSTAQSTLDQLSSQRSSLREASSALADIDAQLAAVIAQQELLLHPDTERAVSLLEQVPEDTQLSLISAALDSFLRLINSAQAYGFYYDVNESVWTVANRLRDFMDGVRSDADYLSSPEAASVIERIESGEEGVGETPEYAALEAVVSRYAYVPGADELPSAWSSARSATGELLELMDSIDLDAVASRLTEFDLAESIASLTDRINNLRAAVRQLESAMETTFTTTGDVVTAYYEALHRLAAGRAELEAARRQVTDALAAQGLAEADVASALAALDENIPVLQDTLARLLEGIPQLEDGIKEIDDNVQRLEAVLKPIREKISELAEAEAKLAEARSEYDSSQANYQKRLADSLLEFSSLEDELAEAYAELEEGKSYGELCNQFLLWFEEGADPEAVLRAAKAALGDVSVKSDYTFEHSAVKTRIDANLDPIKTISTYVPSLTFSVLMVITFLFMSMIVRQCRREIGILRAMGHSAGSIRALFCAENLIVTTLANVLGLGFGVFLTWFVGKKNISFFTMPVSLICMDWKGVLRCFLFNTVVGQIATLVSSGYVLKIQPAEAMSRPVPSTTRVPGILGALTHRLKPMTAFSITTLFRNPLRFFVSVLCIAASIMLIFSSFSMRTSQDHQLSAVYEKQMNYDFRIYFNGDSEEICAELRTLGIARDLQSAPMYLTDIAFDGKSESAIIVALEPGTELLRLYDRTGDRLSTSLSENGILLEEHLAERLGAGIGDTVLVDGKRSMTVEAISFQGTSQTQFISLHGAQDMEESIGSVIGHMEPEREQELLEALVEREDYLYTVFTRLEYQGTLEQLSDYYFIEWFIIAFAVVLGFLIVLNTARTNLLEKKKELCILRTLGFQHWEISVSWFSQAVVQFVFAGILGLPLGRVAAEAFIRNVSTEMREYVYANTWREVFITLSCVALYLVVSHFAAMRDLKKWDIVESVKEKE